MPHYTYVTKINRLRVSSTQKDNLFIKFGIYSLHCPSDCFNSRAFSTNFISSSNNDTPCKMVSTCKLLKSNPRKKKQKKKRNLEILQSKSLRDWAQTATFSSELGEYAQKAKRRGGIKVENQYDSICTYTHATWK